MTFVGFKTRIYDNDCYYFYILLYLRVTHGIVVIATGKLFSSE